MEEGNDFCSIRSLSVVSLGVSTEDVTLLAPDKCPDPPMASSLAGPWPPLPHSPASALTMTVTFLHTLHHYHYPARVWGKLDKHWAAGALWRKSCFILYLLSELELPSLQFVFDIISGWKYSTTKWLLWLKVFFLLFQSTLIKPSNTCITRLFWCQR